MLMTIIGLFKAAPPNTGRLDKFLLARRIPRAEVIERLQVGAVELAEGADPAEGQVAERGPPFSYRH
jgi:hypothetical protein